MIKRGVIYVAIGQGYYDVARRSAETVRAHNPDLGITIFTDITDTDDVFDQTVQVENPHHRSKVDYIGKTPYVETLFLDCDTVVRADLSPFFDILDRFDIALTHVVLWHRPGHNRFWKTKLPQPFAELNTGVILFRKTPRVMDFLETWRAAFHDLGHFNDQITMRELLWASDLRLYVFPPQFNKRVFEASELIYSDAPKARILHLELLRPQKNPVLRWLSNRIK